MEREHVSIRLPPWDGRAREVGEVWTLSRHWRVAVCALHTHPSGGEARITIDGERFRSEVGRDGEALLDLALEWRQQFIENGWRR